MFGSVTPAQAGHQLSGVIGRDWPQGTKGWGPALPSLASESPAGAQASGPDSRGEPSSAGEPGPAPGCGGSLSLHPELGHWCAWCPRLQAAPS